LSQAVHKVSAKAEEVVRHRALNTTQHSQIAALH